MLWCVLPALVFRLRHASPLQISVPEMYSESPESCERMSGLRKYISNFLHFLFALWTYLVLTYKP